MPEELPNLKPPRYNGGAYARGPAVKRLKSILRSQGYPVGDTDVYDAATVNQVMTFQSQHLDEDGRYLVPDGWVGPKTWWALLNPTGDRQRSYLESYVVRGLSEPRRKLLSYARQLHLQNVREVPDGANSGDGVDPIIAGFGAAPWCCLAVSYMFKNALGAYLMKKRYALVKAMWDDAVKAKIAYTVKSGYTPIPGDVMVILYRNRRGQLTGSGHTGLVAAVAQDSLFFNTFAGNEGNRFKAGTRSMNESVLVGFINPWGNDSPNFERGLFLANAAAGDTTR